VALEEQQKRASEVLTGGDNVPENIDISGKNVVIKMEGDSTSDIVDEDGNSSSIIASNVTAAGTDNENENIIGDNEVSVQLLGLSDKDGLFFSQYLQQFGRMNSSENPSSPVLCDTAQMYRKAVENRTLSEYPITTLIGHGDSSSTDTDTRTGSDVISSTEPHSVRALAQVLRLNPWTAHICSYIQYRKDHPCPSSGQSE